MFEAACREYSLWKCNVGGGSDSVEGKLHGIGCVLDQRHVLTARHVWFEIRKDYSWPVVLKYDGLFRCEVALESRDFDIAVLRTTRRIHPVKWNSPTAFPKLSPLPLMIGASVGFLSTVELHKSLDERERHTFFGGGSISYFENSSDSSGYSYVLSGTVIQKGMSGSPVFRPDASLSGVCIQTTSFRADFHDPTAPIYRLPVVSPIAPLRSEIEKLLSGAAT